jgi:uncharacterized protein YutE (UPF0331/DUF86 family)
MKKLIEEVSIEKGFITQTLQVIKDAKHRFPQTPVELSAIGAGLHQVYSGMENILKRILKFKGVAVPALSSSHKDLLTLSVQENIISENLSDQLDSYRGFRHFFIHGYGVMLNDEELNPLAEEVETVWQNFINEITYYLYIMMRVEKGKIAARKGESITIDDLIKEIEKW